MKTLRGLMGLFVDDGKLALTVIGVLVAVGLATHFDALDEPPALTLLVVGTIGALLASVLRAATTAQR